MVTRLQDDDTSRPAAVAGRWTPRLVCSLISIVLVLELLAVSYQMISVSVPAISEHYRTTQGAWLLTSFLLVGAVTAPLLGKLADTHGKRKLLLVAIGVSAIGSFVAAIAPSYGWLLVGRALQGLLVACLFLSYSLIRDVYPPRKVALAVSIATSGMGLIAIPSPWLTGWLLDTWGFRSIFWMFVICLVVLGFAIALTTDETTVRLHSRIDLLGSVLLGSGIAGVLVGVSFGPTWGWRAGSTLGFIFAGAALLVAWLVAARLVREPLVDITFFRQRPIILTAVTGGLSYASTAVFTVLLPMMCMTPELLGLDYGFGVTAKGFAQFQAPIGAAAVVGGLIVGFCVPRIHPRLFMAAGQLFLVLGAVLTAYSHDTKGALIAFALIEGLGLGMTYAAVPNLVIAAVPAKLQATTSSMVSVFQSGLAAILPVIVFTVLNSHIATVLQGNAFYTNEGIRLGFLIAAGAALVGGLAALALPARSSRVPVPESVEPDRRGDEVLVS
ncbi:MFS transporter [Antrihabitans sp. YC2-6]|uniref:MFS transporter n=1 Tax=Antrihabitans sp. YC2-6 TaxID=2799498 RepID=UPI0018F714F9|nr:MFS transporter [Antrihabitans sp. YC2-6]MBJ8344717.1 MFS transporter [Antrihabitans sp. YC2-6]